MEYYTEIWSMAIDNAAKVDKVEGYEINLSFAKVAYTARDNDVVVASLNKGGQVTL